MKKFDTKTLLTGGMLVSALAFPAHAQESIDEVIVTGIKSSLLNALNEKRNSDNLIEVIQAEDIGKLPDQNLAEVLETSQESKLRVLRVLVPVFKFGVRMPTELKSMVFQLLVPVLVVLEWIMKTYPLP